MTSYRIFSALGSGGVPVEAAMTLIGLPYEIVEAPTWEGEAEKAKVATVNPLSLVRCTTVAQVPATALERPMSGWASRSFTRGSP